jgi:TP901 family phage tail tape measure protein
MNIGDLFVRLGLDLSDFSKGLQQAQSELEKVEQSFTKTGMSLSAALTAPLALIGGGSLKIFAGFDNELNKIQALADTTGDELNKLREQAMKLGADTQFSAKQAAEAMSEYAASGFTANQISAAMPGVLDLAAAGQMNVARAAEISAAVLRGFNLAATDTQRVADVLAKASAMSAANVQDLGSSFQYAGGIAATMGVKFEELAAAFAVLGNMGVKGETAGTAMRAFFQDLLQQSAKTKEVLARLNITLTDSNGKFRGLVDILTEMKAKGLGEGPKGMADAFAIWSSRAGDIVKLIQASGTEMNKVVGELDKASGAAEKMRQIMQQGLGGSWEQFTGSVETLAIRIGEMLAPTAKKAVDIIKDLVDKLSILVAGFKTLPEGVQAGIIGFGVLVAAVGPALVAIGAMAGAVSNLKLLPVMLAEVGLGFTNFGGKLSSLQTMLTGFVSSIASINFSSIASGIGNSIKGIGTAVADAVTSIPSKISGLKDALTAGFSSAVGAISAFGKQAGQEMKGAVAIFAGEFMVLKDAIKAEGLMSALGGLASSIGTSLVGAFTAAGSSIAGFGSALVAAAAPIAAVIAAIAALAAAGYAICKNWDEIKAVLVGVWKDLQVAFAAFGTWFMNTIEKVFGTQAASIVKSVWTGIVSFFSSAWDTLKSIASNAFKYILEAAQAAANAIGASNTAAALQSWIVKLDGMGSSAKLAATNVGNAMDQMSVDATKAATAHVSVAKAITSSGGAAELSKKQIKDLADAQKLAEQNSRTLATETMKLTQVFEGIPKTVQDFIDKFAKISDVAPEVQKAGQYIDGLKSKLASLRDETSQAFSKGNSALGKELSYMADQLDMAIKKAEAFKRQMEISFNISASLDPVVKEIDKAFQSMSVLNNEAIKLPPIFKELSDARWAEAMKAPINDVGNLVQAFKQLNVTSSETFAKQAQNAAYYFSVIEKAYEAGKVSLNDLKAAAVANYDAQIKAAAAAGQSVDDLRKKQGQLKAELEAAGYAIKGHGEAVRDYWQQLDKQISTIFTDFGKGIADAMFSAKSLGDFFSKVFVEMGKSIVRFTVEYWSKIWLTELYKGIKGMTDFGIASAKSFKILNGMDISGLTDATGAPVKLPDVPTNPTVPGGTTGTGGLSGLTKAAGGLLGAVGAISSAIDAVFGALQYFQGRRIEQDVGRMEVTTRGILNVLLQIQEVVGQHLPALQDLRFLQNFNLQMGQVADIITINFDKLIDAIKEGIVVSGDVNTTTKDKPTGGGTGSTIDPVTGLPTPSNDAEVLKRQIKELQDLLIKQAQSAANAAAINAGVAKDAATSVTTATDTLSDVVASGTSNISSAVTNFGPQLGDFVEASSVLTAEAIAKSGSYYEATIEALRQGILLNVSTLDRSQLSQDQLIEISRVANEMLGQSIEVMDKNGQLAKVYYSAMSASADGNTAAINSNTDGTYVNSEGMGLLGDALGDNSDATTSAARAGLMSSEMLTTSERQLSKTMEIAAKTYANAANITAPDFSSAYSSTSETQAYIDALAKMLGADKGAQPIYSDPMWIKYLDLVGAYKGSGSNSGKGGIGSGAGNGVTTSSQSLFNAWPSYAELFPNSADISSNLNAAAQAASTLAAKQSSANATGYSTTGASTLAKNPPSATNTVNNTFNGVTDPAKMADKIVKSMSLQGVTF